jgi:hypothetical protein
MVNALDLLHHGNKAMAENLGLLEGGDDKLDNVGHVNHSNVRVVLGIEDRSRQDIVACKNLDNHTRAFQYESGNSEAE